VIVTEDKNCILFDWKIAEFLQNEFVAGIAA
jgi:hypothetical protein